MAFAGGELEHLEWVRRLIVPFMISFVLTLIRRYVPAPPAPESTYRYDRRQVPEPLPPGVVGGFMWLVAILLLLTFFLFRWANHAWAQADGSAVLRVYEGAAIWCFAPGFAALTVPWPLTVWLLRRSGRTDEADSITAESNRRGGMDSYRVMRAFVIWIVVPITIFTLFAIPMHLSIAPTEVRVGHYGKAMPEKFELSTASQATLIEGNRDRYGKLHRNRDLLIDFADGRRLDANAAGDGSNSVSDEVVRLLLSETRLTLKHAETKDDIPSSFRKEIAEGSTRRLHGSF